MFIGGDEGIGQHGLVSMKGNKCPAESCCSRADGFDFLAGQNQPCFKFLEDCIVKIGFFVASEGGHKRFTENLLYCILVLSLFQIEGLFIIYCMEERSIQISAKTILKVIGILFALYLLFLVREILLALFVSIIIASIIEPLAVHFEKKRIPRMLAAILVYIAVFGLIGFAFAVLIPVVLRDVPQVVAQLHDYIQNISEGSKKLK